MPAARRPSLVIPSGAGFDQPEHHVFTFDVALNADELIGLLGTFSWITTMTDVTVDVAFRADAWRAHRHSE